MLVLLIPLHGLLMLQTVHCSRLFSQLYADSAHLKPHTRFSSYRRCRTCTRRQLYPGVALPLYWEQPSERCSFPNLYRGGIISDVKGSAYLVFTSGAIATAKSMGGKCLLLLICEIKGITAQIDIDTCN